MRIAPLTANAFGQCFTWQWLLFLMPFMAGSAVVFAQELSLSDTKKYVAEKIETYGVGLPGNPTKWNVIDETEVLKIRKALVDGPLKNLNRAASINTYQAVQRDRLNEVLNLLGAGDCLLYVREETVDNYVQLYRIPLETLRSPIASDNNLTLRTSLDQNSITNIIAAGGAGIFLPPKQVSELTINLSHRNVANRLKKAFNRLVTLCRPPEKMDPFK